VPEQRPIDRAFFREGPDGSTVFFPWGLTHRGYRLPDAIARKRASRAASLMIGSSIAIGGWTAQALQPMLREAGAREIPEVLAGPGVALLVVFLVYAAWVTRFVEEFPESDLQVSREERLREAAGLAPPRKVALIGVTLCALSALLAGLQPRVWWLGLLGVALGVGALWWSWLLKRASVDPSGTTRPE
jgi:hypothetical protein